MEGVGVIRNVYFEGGVNCNISMTSECHPEM